MAGIWNAKRIILAVTMFVTGSINSLSTKWADNSEAEGSDGVTRKFDHPFLQAVGMFIGEMSCLLVFHIIRLYKNHKQIPQDLGDQSFSPLIFLPPAMCDMLGTSLMYLGLNFTYVSSFQMLRGAVIFFTALLSVAFLGRTIKVSMWVGIGWVAAGLVVVGLSDILFNNSQNVDANGILTGDLLIIMAQVIVALQMVVEEKFLYKYKVPALQAVGWEGFFGFTVLGLLCIPMYFIPVGSFSTNPGHRLEDAIDAFTQMGNNPIIVVATLGNIVSIAFFNFSGISVTKEISATTRMVLDSLRTLAIWAFSIAVGWQMFQYLQIIGFILLTVGMLIYNDILFAPLLRKYGFLKPSDEEMESKTSDETDPLLSSGVPDIQYKAVE